MLQPSLKLILSSSRIEMLSILKNTLSLNPLGCVRCLATYVRSILQAIRSRYRAVTAPTCQLKVLDENSRRCGVIALKIGMMPVWDRWGTRIPCTIVQVCSCSVVVHCWSKMIDWELPSHTNQEWAWKEDDPPSSGCRPYQIEECHKAIAWSLQESSGGAQNEVGRVPRYWRCYSASGYVVIRWKGKKMWVKLWNVIILLFFFFQHQIISFFFILSLSFFFSYSSSYYFLF